VRSLRTLSAIPLFDQERHHSSVPTSAAQPPSSAAERPVRSSFTRTVACTVACWPPVGFAARYATAAVLLAVPRSHPFEKGSNRILSIPFAVLAVGSWEQGQTDRGWQGKSAAVGRAHVVGGVEVLRGTRNDQAVAPFQIVKKISAARAVGPRKVAVRPS